MNERIQELCKEAVNSASAELHEWNKNWQPGKHTNFEYEKVLYKKFAELIVRECIKVSVPVLDESYEDMDEFEKGWVEGQDVAVEKIKEHFGVEK